jgi:hypothetical protein
MIRLMLRRLSVVALKIGHDKKAPVKTRSNECPNQELDYLLSFWLPI